MPTLSFFRRNTTLGFDKLGVCVKVHRMMYNPGTGGMRAQVIVTFPVGSGANRPLGKSTTTVRAGVIQDQFDARCAKRTLEGTDPRLGGAWRQGLVAVFTGWS